MSSQPSRVVIDTNVWISFIINKQQQVLTRLILDNDLTVYGSDSLHDELADVLPRRKFQKRLDRPVADYVLFQRLVTVWVATKPVYKEAPDPKDNFLFDLAFQAGAAYLVTGDRKLLALERVGSVQVVSLTEFKALLKNN